MQKKIQLQQRQRTLSEESVFGYYILWAEISLHASEQQRENNDLPMWMNTCLCAWYMRICVYAYGDMDDVYVRDKKHKIIMHKITEERRRRRRRRTEQDRKFVQKRESSEGRWKKWRRNNNNPASNHTKLTTTTTTNNHSFVHKSKLWVTEAHLQNPQCSQCKCSLFLFLSIL